MKRESECLGDAVHASFDGFQIELRTGDGNNQVIYLEPSVYLALERYAHRCWEFGDTAERTASEVVK